MDNTAYIVGAVIGSLVIGGLLGLIPFFIARKRGKKNMGVICLVLCMLGSFVAGLFLSVPICLISVIVILLVKKKDESVEPSVQSLPQTESYGQPELRTDTKQKAEVEQNYRVEANPQGFCPQCGGRLTGDEIYCRNCGNKVR